MSELLESVKRLAEAQNDVDAKLKNVGGYFGAEAAFSAYDQLARQLDAVALAKHLARLERVEAAAKARKAAYDAAPGTPYGVDETPELEEAERALDAALSENTDVE